MRFMRYEGCMNKYFLIAAGAAVVSVGMGYGYWFMQNPQMDDASSGKFESAKVQEAKNGEEKNETLIKREENTQKNENEVSVEERTVVEESVSCEGRVSAQVARGEVVVYLNEKHVASHDLKDFQDIFDIGESVEASIEEKNGCMVLVSLSATGKGGAIYFRGADALFGGNLATGKTWYISSNEKNISAQDISLDGKRIAGIARMTSGDYQIVMIDAKSGEITKTYALSQNFDEVSMPIWSPDGKSIAFVGAYKFEEEKTQVVRMYEASGEMSILQESTGVLSITSWTGALPQTRVE